MLTQLGKLKLLRRKNYKTCTRMHTKMLLKNSVHKMKFFLFSISNSKSTTKQFSRPKSGDFQTSFKLANFLTQSSRRWTF